MFSTDAVARILDCDPDLLPVSPSGESWTVGEMVRAAVAVSLCASVTRENLAEINAMLRLDEVVTEVRIEAILVASREGFVMTDLPGMVDLVKQSDGKVSHIIDLEALTLRIQLAASLEAQYGKTPE